MSYMADFRGEGDRWPALEPADHGPTSVLLTDQNAICELYFQWPTLARISPLFSHRYSFRIPRSATQAIVIFYNQPRVDARWSADITLRMIVVDHQH